MNFLSKIEIRSNEIKIPVEDVYANDQLFQDFVSSVTDLLYKFSHKFKISEKETVDIFIKQLKKGI